MRPTAFVRKQDLRRAGWILALVLGATAGDGLAAGIITYQEGASIYRVEAESGAVPESLTVGLDALSARAFDDFANVSPDGTWLLISTERFDSSCDGWACLAVVAADLSQGEVIRPGGSDPVHAGGFSAIASGGNLVVFPDSGGPHETDLWAVSRSGGSWGPTVLLTSSSSHDYNEQPAISDDGTTVVFDCGPVPYGQEGTGICVVATDGSGFDDVLAPDDPEAPAGAIAIHHPDFAPDGSIVVEIDTGTETIWRLPGGLPPAVQIEAGFTNDNSPCVLPDGRVASLWLNAPDNPSGDHEIKLMGADGSDSFRVVSGVDVVDIGIGCGGASEAAIFSSDFESGNTSQWTLAVD